MKYVFVGGILVLSLIGTSGIAVAQQIPPANANERAPCTAQLASSFGPATGGIADEVILTKAIADRLGIPLGQLTRVAASTQGTVAECVAFLLSL